MALLPQEKAIKGSITLGTLADFASLQTIVTR
jgi:hypothetical protein